MILERLRKALFEMLSISVGTGQDVTGASGPLSKGKIKKKKDHTVAIAGFAWRPRKTIFWKLAEWRGKKSRSRRICKNRERDPAMSANSNRERGRARHARPRT